MKSVIIGSTAAVKMGLLEKSNDIDVMSTEKIDGMDCIIVPQDIVDMIPHVDGYATGDALYTIKMSHLGWDIKWYKHLQHFLILKSKGCTKIPELYEKLLEYWKAQNGNKPQLSLLKTKSEFFNDYVTYVYDHDYLHSLVAGNNIPIYSKCLKDGEQVYIDKNKFFKLPKEEQLRMFKEEITVIAIERWLVNPKTIGKVSILKAYQFSLCKTMTSLVKNWCVDFMLENIEYYIKPDMQMFYNCIARLKEFDMITKNNKDFNIFSTELYNDMLIKYRNTNKGSYIITKQKFFEYLVQGYSVPDIKIQKYDKEYNDGTRENHYCIFEYENKFYRLESMYIKHSGFDFNNTLITEVVPLQKTITQWETV